MTVLLLILVNILLSVGGQLLLKAGMNRVGSFQFTSLVPFFKQVFLSYYIWGGLVLYGLGMVVWLVLLSKVDLSFAYPMLSLGYILILFTSWYFLGEQVTFYRSLGVFLIILGVFAIFKG